MPCLLNDSLVTFPAAQSQIWQLSAQKHFYCLPPCKINSELLAIPSLYAYSVPYDFTTPANKRWNLFFHPWNLALVIWLALVNGALEKCDISKTYKVFAYWDLPSLATFGLLSQPMRRSPCFHPGEWDLLESGAEPWALEPSSANSSHRPNSTCSVFWHSLS